MRVYAGLMCENHLDIGIYLYIYYMYSYITLKKKVEKYNPISRYNLYLTDLGWNRKE